MNRRTPLTLAVTYVFAAVAILLVLGMLIRTSDNADAIREAQKTNTETLDRINDCTTPGRECYDDGTKRTAAAVGSINKVAVFAAACADRPGWQSTEQIESCIRAKLARNAAR